LDWIGLESRVSPTSSPGNSPPPPIIHGTLRGLSLRTTPILGHQCSVPLLVVHISLASPHFSTLMPCLSSALPAPSQSQANPCFVCRVSFASASWRAQGAVSLAARMKHLQTAAYICDPTTPKWKSRSSCLLTRSEYRCIIILVCAARGTA